MVTVALNNMGFHRAVPDADRYMSAGVEGYIQAAVDLGLTALQLQTGATGEFRDGESIRNADTTRVRRELEAANIEMRLHHHGQEALWRGAGARDAPRGRGRHARLPSGDPSFAGSRFRRLAEPRDIPDAPEVSG